jgi:hypothetical protein
MVCSRLPRRQPRLLSPATTICALALSCALSCHDVETVVAGGGYVERARERLPKKGGGGKNLAWHDVESAVAGGSYTERARRASQRVE